MSAPTEHPPWCDRDRCDRLRAHVSPVLPIDTNRPEESVLDVALMQPWTPVTDPQVSLTVITGGEIQQVLMSVGQARVLTYQIRKLLTAAGEGPR